MLTDHPRWSGFHSQSLAWQRGYDWAYDRGPYAGMASDDACEAWGYEWYCEDGDDPKGDDFKKGIDFAQREQDE